MEEGLDSKAIVLEHQDLKEKYQELVTKNRKQTIRYESKLKKLGNKLKNMFA